MRRRGKTTFSKTIMKVMHRTTIAAYMSAQKHLRGDLRVAKTLTLMAKEIGTTKSTVRRWLRRDHWSLWMAHWGSVEEIWEASRQDRQRLPQRERQARQLAEEQCRTALPVHLDRCLAELSSRGQPHHMG
jgi:predicted transcriptional regulator